MPIYKLKLMHKRYVATNTVELIFDKPETLNFVPGQYGGFTLINPNETDAGGITRRFSILSCPDDTHLAIATRIQNSAYKRVLNQLAKGDEIKFAGPTGNFVLHSNQDVPAVFIAGGIGITPFYSMIHHAINQQSKQALTLFYGNQSRLDACYLDEIQQLQSRHPHLRYVPALANPDEQWSGETGFITHTMLKKHIPDIHAPVYYICGSPAMVTALQETLMEMGISAEQIKVEDFPGY